MPRAQRMRLPAESRARPPGIWRGDAKHGQNHLSRGLADSENDENEQRKIIDASAEPQNPSTVRPSGVWKDSVQERRQHNCGNKREKTIATIIQTNNMVRRCSSSDENASEIDDGGRWIGSVARPQLKRTKKAAVRMNPTLAN